MWGCVSWKGTESGYLCLSVSKCGVEQSNADGCNSAHQNNRYRDLQQKYVRSLWKNNST